MDVTFWDVTVRYGEKAVFSHFTHTLSFSGVTALMGASGVGKTTFLRVLCGLEKPQSGTVEGFPARFTYLFQENRLLPWLDTLQNVAIVCDEASARTALEKVGLGEELHTKPAALSGGCAAVQHWRAPWRTAANSCEAQRRPVLFVTHDPREVQSLGAAVLELHGSPAGL